MGFDADRFQSVNWQRRIEKIPVPALKEFFADGEQPVWTIHSLEGREVAQAKHARERNLRIKLHLEGFAEVLAVKNEKKFKQRVKDSFGNLESEADTAWRTELLILASEDPIVDYPLAAVLHQVQSETYYLITNKIIQLIGQGHEAGKLPASGKTKRSKAR